MKTLRGNQETYRIDQRKYQANFSNGEKLLTPLPLFYIWNLLTPNHDVIITKLTLIK